MFVVLSFLTLVFYGLWVASGVVAEKASRVMELLISAATAPQLVVGKISGIGLAGLTQVTLVLLPAVAALLLSGRLAASIFGTGEAAAPSLGGLSPGLLLAFLVYFVLGFALYAAMYAGAGSLLSRPEDLQIVALPLSIPAIMGYFPAVLALSGGAGPIIRFASYVPLWSPFVMMARLSVGSVEPWEVVLSVGLLVDHRPDRHLVLDPRVPGGRPALRAAADDAHVHAGGPRLGRLATAVRGPPTAYSAASSSNGRRRNSASTGAIPVAPSMSSIAASAAPGSPPGVASPSLRGPAVIERHSALCTPGR